MNKRSKGVYVLELYHGTSQDEVDSILRDGLRVSKARVDACVFLAVTAEDAKVYGEVVLAVRFENGEVRLWNDPKPEGYNFSGGLLRPKDPEKPDLVIHQQNWEGPVCWYDDIAPERIRILDEGSPG